MSTILSTQFPEACRKANLAFSAGNEAAVGDFIDKREVFYLSVVEKLGLLKSGIQVVDLGAGFSRFAPVLSQLGPRVTILDDFGGGGGIDHGQNAEQRKETERVLDRLRDQLGLKIIESDILSAPLPFPDRSVDLITCFHVLEHWHHSPKCLFDEIRRVLKPGGHLFIATPNSVNIRKRLWVLFGESNLPKIEDFFEQLPVWRGHVREPTLGDLKKILRWNSFTICLTAGRNFYGRDSRSLRFIPRPIRHAMAYAADLLLKGIPTLCTDIHVVGRKSDA
jgi:SAM-dependent methyltransferase